MAEEKTNLHKDFMDDLQNIMMTLKFAFKNTGLLMRRTEFSPEGMAFCLIEVQTQFSLQSESIADLSVNADPK